MEKGLSLSANSVLNGLGGIRVFSVTSKPKTMNTTEIPEYLKCQIPEAVQRKVAAMDEINREAFLAEFKKKRKSPALAFWILLPFGLHYAYIGRFWITLVFWATLGGFGLWWFIVLFRTFRMVREHNKSVAIEVLKEIQVLN